MQEMPIRDDYSSRNQSHYSQGQVDSLRPQQKALALANHPQKNDDASSEKTDSLNDHEIIHNCFTDITARVSLSYWVSVERGLTDFYGLDNDSNSYWISDRIGKIIQDNNFRGIVIPLLKSLGQEAIHQNKKSLLLKCILRCIIGNYERPLWLYMDRPRRHTGYTRVQSVSDHQAMQILQDTLDLSHANLEEIEAKTLLTMLSVKGSRLSRLRTLNLADNNLSHATLGKWRGSSVMYLAALFSQGHCHLTTLNLSGNKGLGGSTKRWGSGLYHLVVAIQKTNNETLEAFIVSNMGLTDIDVATIAEMSAPHPTLKIVDLSDNQAITELSKVALGKCLKARLENNLSALLLDVSRTKLAMVTEDEQDQHSVQALRTALHLQVDRLNLRALGNQMFELYQEKKYPSEWEYYLKLASTVFFIVGGAAGVVLSGIGLITSILTTVGVLVASAAGIGMSMGSIFSHFIALFKMLSEDEIKLIEELLSLENLVHGFEFIKKGVKLGYHGYHRITAFQKLKLSLNSSEAKKREIDILHAQLEKLAELFVGNDRLCSTIVAGISHHYHEVISRLSARDAKCFAKGLERYLRTFLFGMATIPRDDQHLIPEQFLQHLQFVHFDNYEVVKINGGDFNGYVKTPDKSFSDIFGIEKSAALQLVKESQAKEKFTQIMISSKSFFDDLSHTCSEGMFMVHVGRNERVDYYFLSDSDRVRYFGDEDNVENKMYFDIINKEYIVDRDKNPDDPSHVGWHRLSSVPTKRAEPVDINTFISQLKDFDSDLSFSLAELLDQQLVNLSGNFNEKKTKARPLVIEPGLEKESFARLKSRREEGKHCISSDDPVGETTALIKSVTATLFFMTQESHYDLAQAHPALLQALARIRGITLYLWEKGADGRLVPYHEVSCARYVHADKAALRMDLLMENQHRFSQITFLGYPNKTPTEADGPILSLNAQQEKEIKANQVWLAHLVQRSGFKCQNGANETLRFNISTKVTDKEEWITTAHETYGCRQLSNTLLDIIRPMVSAYRVAVEKNEMTSACGNYKLSRETLQMLVVAGELSVVPLDFRTLCQEVSEVKEDVKQLKVQGVKHERRIGDNGEKIVEHEAKLGVAEKQNNVYKEELKKAKGEIVVLNKKLSKAEREVTKSKHHVFDLTNFTSNLVRVIRDANPDNPALAPLVEEADRMLQRQAEERRLEAVAATAPQPPEGDAAPDAVEQPARRLSAGVAEIGFLGTKNRSPRSPANASEAKKDDSFGGPNNSNL